MSLAEVFLLVLFVFLWSWRVEESRTRTAIEDAKAAEQRRTKAEESAAELRKSNADLARQLEDVRAKLAAVNPDALVPRGRGLPACSPGRNVIAEIRVNAGRELLRVIDPPVEAIHLDDGRPLVPDLLIAGRIQVESAALRIWEASEQRKCRYDHRRTYCTEGDYLAVDRFQKWLTPSGPIRKHCETN